MRLAVYGRSALAGILLLLAAALGFKQSDLLCHGRWCLQPATKRLQDGPNAVQFPVHHFCERCYTAFIASRPERRSQEGSGKVLIGNQLLDGDLWQVRRLARERDLTRDAAEQTPDSPEQRDVGYAW